MTSDSSGLAFGPYPVMSRPTLEQTGQRNADTVLMSSGLVAPSNRCSHSRSIRSASDGAPHEVHTIFESLMSMPPCTPLARARSTNSLMVVGSGVRSIDGIPSPRLRFRTDHFAVHVSDRWWSGPGR
jgi:hypothetical protein